MSIEVVRNGEILEVTINRPKANAIDAATSREMSAVFESFMKDSQLRVAILTGAGTRFFSAGWDLTAASEGEAFESDYGVGGFGGICELKYRPKPVIVAVNGMAVGGGFEIALAADLIVAAEHAEFFLPEANLGLIADNATIRLPKIVPPNIAREMLISGRRMSATEAQSWGIVNQVTSTENLMTAARELATKICAAAPLSVAAVLELVRDLEDVSTDDAMPILRSNETYRAAINSQDAKEGADAYAEKRSPKWQGK
ncbi:MAG: crotonobetainyl-CoA hydratase [Ilumatobacteraceae bacterium]|jgi:crotonobetainyl-CoA hydratase|nr:crotonobetainyl-CoA hydratase [Ilumatobacteraceae bacterium]